MKCGILVTGEANESDFSFFFCLVECFQDAAFGVGQLGVVVVDDAMDLPEVQVIGLIPPERVFKHLHG